jgi:uncharacterized protein YdhG (YjbR/CyaY superfamily)
MEETIMANAFGTIDEYIASFPHDVRPVLQGVRDAVHAAVPGVTEGISYAIPVFRLEGSPLVQFGGWKRHVGMYPIRAGTEFEEALEPYRSTKDTVKFPLDEPMPYELIRQVIAAMATERQQA